MAILNHGQREKFCSILGGDLDWVELWIPPGDQGPVRARKHDLDTRACWNWALNGSMEANPGAATSAISLYANTAPIDYLNIAGPLPRVALGPAPLPTIPAVQWANVQAAWLAANAPGAADPAKILFMKRMAIVAAEANGLQLAVGPTPYKIHMTGKRHEWYSWDHWALSITHANRTVFVQVEAGNRLKWGHTRLWEANRPHNIEASFFITEIHQAHKDAIEVFLSLPMCRLCRRVKPGTTTWSTRWHQCGGRVRHVYCGNCATERLPWNGVFSRTRRCNALYCNQPTALMD